MNKLILFILLFKLNTQAQTTINLFNKPVTFSDDNLHYLAGYGISAGASYTMYFLTDKPGLSLAAGFLTATAAGIIKETIHDKYLKLGNPDILDATSTAWGGLVANITIIVTIDIERKNNKHHFLYKQKHKQKINYFNL